MMEDQFRTSVDEIFQYLSTQNYPDRLAVKRDGKKEFRRKCTNFTLRDGTLLFVGARKEKSARVITERGEQLRIVQACHEGLGDTMEAQALSGHFGRDKTQARITERFYWPTITKDVTDFVHSCDTCQRVNKRFRKGVGELQPIPVKPEAFQRIGIDLVGPIPETAEGYKYFATAICAYTKWVESEPLKTKSAVDVSKFIYRIICRHGCFEIEISDQGREFVNQVSAELHKLTGVDHRMTSAYHPQCNGLAEKQNQTTQNVLLKYLDKQDEWAQILDSVLFAYRTSKHCSTGYTPFYLLYGREPRLPVELMVENASNETTNNEEEARDDISMEQKIEAMEKLRKVAAGTAMDNIHVAQNRQKKSYEKRNKLVNFDVGTEVLLEEKKNVNRCGGKFDERYTGPYTVTEVVKKGVYRLRRNGKDLKKTVNGKRLKIYIRRNVESTPNSVEDPKPPTPNSVEDPTPPTPNSVEDPTPPTPNSVEDPTPPTPNSVEDPTPPTPNSVEDPTPPMPNSVEDPTPSTPNSVEDPTPPTPNSVEDPTPPTPNSVEDPTPPMPNSVEDCIITDFTSSKSNADKRKYQHPKFRALDDERLNTIQQEHSWLDDLDINSAQALLRQEFQFIGDLQDTCLAKNNQFNVEPNEFIQIYNANQSHWVLISTVGCTRGEVNVYDSLYTTLHGDTRRTIASLLHCPLDELRVNIPFVQQQKNGSDCGIYAVAFATSLLNGDSPSEVTYDQTSMRQHFVTCLKNGQMQPFPTAPVPSKRRRLALPKLINVPTNCFCRQPDKRPMRQCLKCKRSCHLQCLPAILYCGQCMP